MKVLVVEPGYLPYEKEIHGLREMQHTVGGLITAIYPYEDAVAIVCNDEAILMHMTFNRSVPGGYGGVFGTFFICGLTEDNFCSLSPAQMQKYKQEFKDAELLIGVKGNDLFTKKFPAAVKRPTKKKEKPSPEYGR